ncbi:MAG: hypothetical protein CMP34_01995 [Rickettsiales bacterium]|nr:hypothetical protein [Rickettsiales bacterium]|tara:strand:- start:1335 stop:2876 length:1542 start_codon:yes stop_codon:yes gene_type:complete
MNKKTLELNFFISIFVSFHWPILNLLNVNFIEFFKNGILSILQTELIILSLSFFVLLIFKLLCMKFPKERESFYLFIFFSLCMFFFFFKQIYSTLGNFISAYLNMDTGAYILFLTLYFIFVYFIFNLKNIKKLASFTVIFSYFLIIQPIFSLTLKYINFDSSEKSSDQPFNFHDLKFKNRPNIYIIIPDGYVGPRNLKKLTGLSLDNFFQQMNNYNFKVVDNPKSNYLGSASSVASFFHMEYFRDEFSDKYNPPPSDYFPAVLNKTNLPIFLKYLKNNSYNFFMTSNWYVACQKNNFNCVEESYSRFRFTQASNLIFKNTPLDLLFPNLFYLKVDNLSFVEKNFNEILSYEQPIFFFIHLMQPHDPHYFDKDCNVLDIKKIQAKDRLQNYKEAVQCVNKNLLRFASKLKTSDSNSIAIIFSDHGSGYIANRRNTPYSQSKLALDERTETIMLVKSPQECHHLLKPQMGPINLSRFIISCLSNTNIEYLDERILVPGQNYDETNSLIESFILKE